LIPQPTVTIRTTTTGIPITSTIIVATQTTVSPPHSSPHIFHTNKPQDIPAQATATVSLAFCNYGTLTAKSDHAIFDVDCETSYTDLAGGYYKTVNIADDCFNLCDGDEHCYFFTFEAGSTSNNCYLAYGGQGGNGVSDPNAKSGYFTGNFAS